MGFGTAEEASVCFARFACPENEVGVVNVVNTVGLAAADNAVGTAVLVGLVASTIVKFETEVVFRAVAVKSGSNNNAVADRVIIGAVDTVADTWLPVMVNVPERILAKLSVDVVEGVVRVVAPQGELLVLAREDGPFHDVTVMVDARLGHARPLVGKNVEFRKW